MLTRLRSHLSYSNVMATIAVLFAVGGGYAVAVVGGSGTVQRAGEVGFTSTIEDVRTLRGIGALQASCSLFTSGGSTVLYLRNNSGKTLNVEGHRQVSGLSSPEFGDVSASVRSDNDPVNIVEGTALDPALNVSFHISPRNGSPQPQADVNVTISHVANNCAASKVTVLALNTEA